MMTTTPKTLAANLRPMLESIADRARASEAAAAAALDAAREERLEAERAVRVLAKGTRDVTKQAVAAVTSSRPLVERIEDLLRGPLAPLSLRQITAAVGEPAGRVQACLKKLRNTACPTRSRDDAEDARQVYNLGTEDDPIWIWVVGDETSPEELTAVVRKLISFKPMTFSELTLATGARRGRLSGRLVQMQRDGENLSDENTDKGSRNYRWFLRAPKRRR